MARTVHWGNESGYQGTQIATTAYNSSHIVVRSCPLLLSTLQARFTVRERPLFRWHFVDEHEPASRQWNELCCSSPALCAGDGAGRRGRRRHAICCRAAAALAGPTPTCTAARRVIPFRDCIVGVAVVIGAAMSNTARCRCRANPPLLLFLHKFPRSTASLFFCSLVGPLYNVGVQQPKSGEARLVRRTVDNEADRRSSVIMNGLCEIGCLVAIIEDSGVEHRHVETA